MACSYHVRKDCWYYPWIKSMLGWVGFGEDFSLFPVSLCLYICQWYPHFCIWPSSHRLFRVHLVTPLALPPYLPLSHCSLARTRCPHSQNALLPLLAFTCLSRLCCSFSSFSSSGTCDLNDGKSRVKEKGDNGKRSSRKKRKTIKERERVPFVDSQLYHTTLELMGNGSPLSASDPFASICT